MLNKLRNKFVCINMIIVTAMLCVIFGLVIHFTADALERESLQMLQAITDRPIRSGQPDVPPDQMRLPYFMVTLSPRGELTVTGDGYFDLSDEDLILQIAEDALSLQDQTGALDEYDLRFYKASTPFGLRIVFADTSSEQTTLNNLIKTCALIGSFSFGIFLLISLVLAAWAVKPVDKAWQQQKQFVADASHELKTPLTVIMTNAELLQSQEITQQDQQRCRDSILTMSHQMRGLVENLLELARVDNGSVQTAFVQLNLSQLICDGILPFEPMYFEKGLTLRSQIEAGIRVKGSLPHLGQVLEILLDNAMKYSTPQGLVWVILKRQGNHGILAVSNPGPPIAHDDLKNIFKRFYRVDKARSRDGSYGLGLAIAKSIVTEHRGRIWAESNGGINTFVIELPINSVRF